jgi:peptide/nickel transport system permease protein
VLFARSQGLSPGRVLVRYAARGALLPNLAAFGVELGFVLSGSILTEIVFSYPGEGYLIVGAVQSLDYPLLQGLFLVLTIAVLLANWLVDLVSVVLDPRLRRSA